MAKPSRTQPHSSQSTIADLLVAASRGDEAAWREIIGRYGRRIFALAKSRCRSAELAEEVTQDVFVTCATKLGGGGYTEQGRFESWLFRVAMNRVRDELRRIARQAAPTDPAAFGGTRAPDEQVAPTGLDELRGALESLSDTDREVVELRHHGGLSFKQMSDMLGEPIGTLLARHHRALRKLKQILTRSEAAERLGVDP